MKIKKVLILAGGKGTRMRENTSTIPKPMVKIGGIPVLVHIINHFEKFGNFEFIICTGYKEEVIIEYFENKKYKNIKILPTGLETNTGGRILKTKELIEDDFFMTYGDGLSDINVNEVINFHISHKKKATISVNKPVSRFGLVDFDSKGKVNSFIEKPILNSYVNMGYMILSPKIYDYINGDEVFENKPLKLLASLGEIYAYKHNGFFRPMDTHREYLELNDLWKKGNAPWKI
tara:strand:+ start:6907 stop:7605 length:699 start_codon:yes stop_codon:yes gene_type:complete